MNDCNGRKADIRCSDAKSDKFRGSGRSRKLQMNTPTNGRCADEVVIHRQNKQSSAERRQHGWRIMYIPPHFQEISYAEIAAVIEAATLTCIVAYTPEGLIANHIPLLSAPDDTLIGHVVLANDMHQMISDGQEVLAIFRGEDA